jgi:hypothetical protein
MKKKNLYILLKRVNGLDGLIYIIKHYFEELCPFQEIGKDMDLGIYTH